MKLREELATQSVRMPSASDPPLFKFQDLCDGISREQYRMKQITRDKTILSARERVLSARSKTSDALSLRTSSRLSSARARKDPNGEIAENDPDLSSANGSSQDLRSNDAKNADKQLVPIATDTNSSRPESPEQSEYENSTFRSEGGASMRVSDEDLTKLTYLNDNDALMRSYASLSGVPVVPAKNRCIRSKSAADREVDGMVRSLSRHCCDVLGPKVCHECALLKRRLHDSTRHEISLSRLQVSEKNFADSIILSKLLPHLSPEEIEDRVVSGEISRMPLRERIYETKQRLSREKRRSSCSLLSTRSLSERRLVKTAYPTSAKAPPFFINIQDLNCKLLVARLTNTLSDSSCSSRSFVRSDSEIANRDAASAQSSYSNASTRQAGEHAPSRFRQWYEPPLLPRICQNVAPAFFAGHAGTYKLPDRLPDEVVEGQVSDMTSFDAAWTGSYPQSEVEESDM